MNLFLLLAVAAGLAAHAAPPPSAALPPVTSPEDTARVAAFCLELPADMRDDAARLVYDRYEADGVAFEGTADTISVLPDGSCVDGYRVRIPGNLGTVQKLPPSSFTTRLDGTYVLLYLGPDKGGQMFASFRIVKEHRTPLGSLVYDVVATDRGP